MSSTDFYAQYSQSYGNNGSASGGDQQRHGRGNNGRQRGNGRQQRQTVANQPLAGLTIGGSTPAPQTANQVLPGLSIGGTNPQYSTPQCHQPSNPSSSEAGGINVLSAINAGFPQQPQHRQEYHQQPSQPPPPAQYGAPSQPMPQTPPMAPQQPAPAGLSPVGTSPVVGMPPAALGSVKRTKDGKYAVGQFVYVPVTRDGKKEIATITDINNDEGTVVIESERSGFAITVKVSQLNRAFLIILDLNGVLVHRKKSKSRGLKRPHVDEFLDFLLKHFVVGVWSSCIPDNGGKIVDFLLGAEQRKLKFQMYRDDCTPNPTPENHYATRKDLLKVWARYPHSFDESNTVIIDDSADKCSHPQNAFVPSTFDGEGAASEEDRELLRVMGILQQVIDTDSLRPIRNPGSVAPLFPGDGDPNTPQVAVAGGPGTATPKKHPTPPAPAVADDEEDEECVVYAPGGL